jgi:dTDP-4-dehydrorhamnose 3,5-epimerase
MQFESTEIPGVIIVEPRVHRDHRGYFLETYHSVKYNEGGLNVTFVQDNQSSSVQYTLRGLHMQSRKPQGKLVRVIEGEIWDVAVDLRPESRTFKRWVGVRLSSEDFRQLYIPEGCAHGFCVLSRRAIVEYKCTALYDPTDEVGVMYNDPELAIRWPVERPIVSERDLRHPPLASTLDQLIGSAMAKAVGS